MAGGEQGTHSTHLAEKLVAVDEWQAEIKIAGGGYPYADSARMPSARAFLQVAEKSGQRDCSKVHGAKDTERRVSGRRRDGEQALSGGGVRLSPARPVR